jgi:hypothetical protein
VRNVRSLRRGRQGLGTEDNSDTELGRPSGRAASIPITNRRLSDLLSPELVWPPACAEFRSTHISVSASSYRRTTSDRDRASEWLLWAPKTGVVNAHHY